MFREAIKCNDGTTISIQASSSHYCTPKEDKLPLTEYTHYELGFPSKEIPCLLEYSEDIECLTSTVYPYVPKAIVKEALDYCGGADLVL